MHHNHMPEAQLRFQLTVFLEWNVVFSYVHVALAAKAAQFGRDTLLEERIVEEIAVHTVLY